MLGYPLIARYTEFASQVTPESFKKERDELCVWYSFAYWGDMGSRTDLGRHGGGIGRDHDFFGYRMVPGVSGLIPKIRFNLARTPVILYFTENKNSISKKF